MNKGLMTMEKKERKNNNPEALSVIVRSATARCNDLGTKCRNIAFLYLPYCVRRFLRCGFTAPQNNKREALTAHCHDRQGLFKKVPAFIATALLCFAMLFPTQTNAQMQCQKTPCTSATKTCIMETQGGRFKQLAANSDMRAACLHERSEKGCLNLTPVSCVGSYGGLGWRPNGAGGNPTPRNHFGSDLGAGACKNSDGTYPEIYVYAAADGKIEYMKTSGGGGRTIAITHTKGCDNPVSGGQYYKTTYRHLLAYAGGLSVGSNVKKDQIIGLVGGSNAKCLGCAPCDATAQRIDKYKQYWTTAGCGKPYAVHLHYEIEDGPANSSSTQASAATAFDPGCNSLQTLCGGCPSAPGDDNCRGGQQGWSDGKGGTADGTFYPGAATGGDAYAAPVVCDYTPYLDSQTCVFCDLFKTMFNTASQIALMADVGLMGPTLNFVKIGFLIWIAVYLLKQLGSFNATNSGELAKGILFQGFRVAIIALILNSQTALFQAMDLTLNPVMMTGLKFTETLSGGEECDKNADYMKNITGYSVKEGYSKGTPTGGLSTEVGESLVCNIKKMEDATGLFMSLGKYSVCLSFNQFPWGEKGGGDDRGLLPGLGYFTTGIFLWLAGLALLLTFPWCLVDCVLQLCIAAALVPCAIGAFAFKITSKYLKIVWNFFMNAMFNFVFMALIVYIINSQLLGWIGLKSPEMVVEQPEIFIRFNGLAWYGMGFIRVAAVSFFCYVFFDEAKSMAEKFADSPGLGGSKGIGRMVGGTVAGAAGQVGAAGFHLGIKGAKTIGSGINAVAGNSFRNRRNQFVGWAASKLGKKTLPTDGTKGHIGSFRLLGRDIKFAATQGEDGKWSLTREVHKRSQSDKAFEKVLDKYGNEVKDENGNTIYRHRKRIFGITRGYEDMTATRDKDGNLVYSTADGKSQFRMGEDNQISSYTTGFTRSYLGFGKVREKQNIKQYGTNRTVSTATSRTREKMDSKGNVTGSEFKMQSFSLFNRDLVRKDGTINIDTFNEMQKSIGDPKRAAQALIAQVMEKRGMKLDSKYADRTIDIDDDGKVTIKQTQKDKDGNVVSTQNIQAVMIGDQMFISNEIVDQAGNSTLNESNGIFRTVQTATKQKDGHFTYNFDGGFSEYALRKNNHISPLNHNGRWGNNIDRDKAMAGFTQSHYDKYLAKLNIKQMHRTTDAETYRNSEEVKRLNGMIHAQGLNSMEEAKQNMTYNLETAKLNGEHGDGRDLYGPDYEKLPDDLKGEAKANLDEVREISTELEKEYTTRDRLEKEQRELQEKEDKSAEEEERIIREKEEEEKKIEELNKKLEEANKKGHDIHVKIRKWIEEHKNENKEGQNPPQPS